MARKLAVRAAGLWPNVLADIIAEYSAYTIEEKLEILMAQWMECGRTSFQSFVCPVLIYVSMFQETGYIYAALAKGDYARISPNDICKSVRTGYWHFSYTGPDRPMTRSEIASLAALFDTVQ